MAKAKVRKKLDHFCEKAIIQKMDEMTKTASRSILEKCKKGGQSKGRGLRRLSLAGEETKFRSNSYVFWTERLQFLDQMVTPFFYEERAS